jgi:hypothetical protein
MVPLIDQIKGSQFSCGYVYTVSRKQRRYMMMYGAPLWKAETPTKEEVQDPLLLAGFTSDKRAGAPPRAPALLCTNYLLAC